jgi:hypothetical protein
MYSFCPSSLVSPTRARHGHFTPSRPRSTEHVRCGIVQLTGKTNAGSTDGCCVFTGCCGQAGRQAMGEQRRTSRGRGRGRDYNLLTTTLMLTGTMKIRLPSTVLNCAHPLTTSHTPSTVELQAEGQVHIASHKKHRGRVGGKRDVELDASKHGRLLVLSCTRRRRLSLSSLSITLHSLHTLAPSQ